MEIINIRPEHFEELLGLDKACFSKEEWSSIKNFELLLKNDEEGAFSAVDDGKVVGYIFSKVIGKEGYFGPVGVLPKYRDKGIGKRLIEKSLEYLKGRCSVISLEVMPEIGKNVGLYYKIGFETVFPSILFSIPDNIITEESFYGIQGRADFRSVKKICSIGAEEIRFLSAINDKEGLDYTNDLRKNIEEGGVAFGLQNNRGELKGFSAFNKDLLPYVWCCIDNSENEESIRLLFGKISEVIPKEKRLILVNGRYRSFINILSQLKFRVVRSRNRMVLKGYEGEYFKTSEMLIGRAHMG